MLILTSLEPLAYFNRLVHWDKTHSNPVFVSGGRNICPWHKPSMSQDFSNATLGRRRFVFGVGCAQRRLSKMESQQARTVTEKLLSRSLALVSTSLPEASASLRPSHHCVAQKKLLELCPFAMSCHWHLNCLDVPCRYRYLVDGVQTSSHTGAALKASPARWKDDLRS